MNATQGASTGWRVQALQALGTLAIAIIGALIARAVQLPLPWMIGAMLATTLVALFDLRIAGHGVRLPMAPRLVMVPVIGVMLGSGFSPEIIGQMAHWWATMAGLLVFVAASLFAVYTLNRRVFGFDKPTAYFAAIPGGVIESAILGEMAGGDGRTISLIHFCRVLLAVLTIPITMRLIFGPVGSVAIAPDALDTALSPSDMALLIGAGVIGFFAAKRIGLPGAAITGPMVLSAIVHVTGWTAAHPPSWLVITAQLVMGATLGSRFAGYALSQAMHAMRAALATVVIMIAIAALIALALRPLMAESFTAMILAYAPGGLAEMSLIALSLNIGVAFVATHHIARIIIAMIGAPIAYRLFIDRTAKLT